MRSPLDNLSLINHQDLICAFNSRKAMGNHNNGFTVSKIADGLLNKMFISGSMLACIAFDQGMTNGAIF